MSSNQSDSCQPFFELSIPQTDTISLAKLTKQKQRHGQKHQKREQMNRFKNWSEADTKKFMRSLELFGTDFYMINFLFNDRTRTQLKVLFIEYYKRKYKKEKNSSQLQSALRNSRVNQMDLYDKLLLFQQEFIDNAASQSFIEVTRKLVCLESRE